MVARFIIFAYAMLLIILALSIFTAGKAGDLET